MSEDPNLPAAPLLNLTQALLPPDNLDASKAEQAAVEEVQDKPSVPGDVELDSQQSPHAQMSKVIRVMRYQGIQDRM